MTATLEQVRLLDRIMRRLIVNEATGCWEWSGALTSGGYGQIRDGGPVPAYVHRLSYALHVGPIPEGLEIDHLCRVRHCANPAHLEAVTHRENSLRGQTIAASYAGRTHCGNGHEYTPENTYALRRRGRVVGRRCRTCVLAGNKAWRERRRAG